MPENLESKSNASRGAGFRRSFAYTVPTEEEWCPPGRLPPADPLFPAQDTGTKCVYYSDQTIFNEGDAATLFFKVVMGCVRLSKMNRGGRRQIVRFLFPEDIFGFESDREHSLSAEALCYTEVLRSPRLNREATDGRDADASRRLLSLARRELSTLQDQLMMLGHQTARERVSSFLIQSCRNQEFEDGRRLDLPMSRLDIADFLGLTIETVCRELGILRRKSIIAIPMRHQIVLNNVAALEAIAAGERD